MKKILVIGAIALVLFGCVLAAGCTSTTSNTIGTDSVVGTWTLPNGTTVVFGDDFKGVMTQGENKVNFTWKKTNDGKYQVDNEKGEQVIWTLDNVKGTMTNAAGAVLSKQTADTSGSIRDNIYLQIYGKDRQNSLGTLIGTNGTDYIAQNPGFQSDHDKNHCLGYYTEPEGGIKILDSDFDFADENIPGYVIEGKWAFDNNVIYALHPISLYGHYSE